MRVYVGKTKSNFPFEVNSITPKAFSLRDTKLIQYVFSGQENTRLAYLVKSYIVTVDAISCIGRIMALKRTSTSRKLSVNTILPLCSLGLSFSYLKEDWVPRA